LEYGGVILMERVVALVRENGRTKILTADNSAGESVFTPQALDARGKRFLGGQNVKESPEGERKGKR
jgi:hypothetical protein